MRVLILSLDGTILDHNSEAFKRMQEYVRLVDELYVFVLSRSRRPQVVAQNNAEKLYLYWFSANLIGWIRALFAGRTLIKEKGIDVVSAQEPFELGLMGLLIKGRTRLNVQLHGDFYGNPFWQKEKLLNRLRWHLGLFVLRRADSIRVVSERIKMSLNSLFLIPNSKIIKVPIYTDVEHFRVTQSSFSLKAKYPQFNFIILAVANLVPVKNLDFLIRVMKKLHEILPNAGLVIVGDGSLRKKLQATSYKLQANDYVIFEGAQEDLVPYYKGADCFVLVSKYEGWGRVVVEAAASSLPIVMTDVGLAGEIIKNEESGLIFWSTPALHRRGAFSVGFRFDQKAEEALAQALSQIYFNQNLRERLIAGAHVAIEKLSTKQATLEAIRQSWEMARSLL